MTQLLSKNGACQSEQSTIIFCGHGVLQVPIHLFRGHSFGWQCRESVHNFLSIPMGLGQGFGKQTSWLVHANAHSLLEAVLGMTATNHRKRCSEALLPKTEAIIGCAASEHRKRFPDQLRQAHFRDAQAEGRSAGPRGRDVPSSTPDWPEDFGNNMPGTASKNS